MFILIMLLWDYRWLVLAFKNNDDVRDELAFGFVFVYGHSEFTYKTSSSNLLNDCLIDNLYIF